MNQVENALREFRELMTFMWPEGYRRWRGSRNRDLQHRDLVRTFFAGYFTAMTATGAATAELMIFMESISKEDWVPRAERFQWRCRDA